MTAILLASKYEDIIPIPADSLIKKAGHNKFTLVELVQLEREVLQALQFNIHLQVDVYNESSLLFSSIVSKLFLSCPASAAAGWKLLIKEGSQFLVFLCYMITYTSQFTQYHLAN